MNRKERNSQLLNEIDVGMLAQSLRNPLRRDNAAEYFRRLTPEIVRSISERDPFTIFYALDKLLDLNILGIENKADCFSNPIYLQGRLDTLLDVAKVTAGLSILKATGRTPKKKPSG